VVKGDLLVAADIHDAQLRVDVPHLDSKVIPAGEEPVVGDGEGNDGQTVPGHHAHTLKALEVPHADCAIVASSVQLSAAAGDSPHEFRMPLESGEASVAG
jgi:hypothetical protein